MFLLVSLMLLDRIHVIAKVVPLCSLLIEKGDESQHCPMREMQGLLTSGIHLRIFHPFPHPNKLDKPDMSYFYQMYVRFYTF